MPSSTLHRTHQSGRVPQPPSLPLDKFLIQIPDMEFWKGLVPCQIGCPVHTDAGRYVQLISQGRIEDAYKTARSPNPFASVCGRVCAAPCEDVCRRGKLDSPVAIRALKRYATERYGVESLYPNTIETLFAGADESGNKWAWHLPLQRQSRQNVATQRVAVVGSGPAGLSCAHDLALMGYRVTVFEATGIPGGMLRQGIPEYRLARSIIDQEFNRIKSLGVEIRFNTRLSEQYGLSDIRGEGFESVFISVGTQRGRSLSIEGAELDGVIKAIDYLLNINSGYRVGVGQRVLIIGGGFVAFDAARTALRGAEDQDSSDLHTAVDAARVARRGGAEEVHLASLESFAEMPVLRTVQGHEEYEEAVREGVRFHPQRGPLRFVGEGGRVRQVVFRGVKRTYDASGKFDPVYDDGLTETLAVDTVILAIGQHPDLSFLRPSDGVELTPSGLIKIDPETLATTSPGVYSGGDVAFGPRNIIDAVANGKRAALSMDAYLRKVTPRTYHVLDIEKLSTRVYERPQGYDTHPRLAPPTIDLQRRTGISEVETGYDDEQARIQSERCLACHIQTIYDPVKCVLCNRCVDVCPEFCLKIVTLETVDLDADTRARLVAHYELDASEPAAAMIKDDDKCIRCGLCAIRCPTDAMTMELFYYEEREAAFAPSLHSPTTLPTGPERR